LDAIDDSDVTLICLASAKLLPDGDDTKAFALVKHELHNGKDEPQTYSKELRKRPLAKLRPADAGAAREALRALVDRQTARLKLILARNQELAEADAAEAPDRLAFDPSPEGERLRRYLLSAARLANQTIKMFLSVVRCPLSVETEGSAGSLEDVGENAFALDWAYANSFAKRKATAGDPFAERTATLGETAEAGAAFVQCEATISAVDASPEDLRSEPNTLPATVQPVASLNPEPFRHRGPAPLETEPNPPPAQLEPGKIESQTSGSPHFPLARLAPPGRVPDTKSGVRGLERDPEAPATTPLRSEPNTLPAKPEPRPLNSRASGGPDSPLAPPGIRHGGPTTMSGVRGVGEGLISTSDDTSTKRTQHAASRAGVSADRIADQRQPQFPPRPTGERSRQHVGGEGVGEGRRSTSDDASTKRTQHAP
jgi:hypothetical protein